jgi:hypothetical protein
LKKPNSSRSRADMGAALRAALAPNIRIPAVVGAYARRGFAEVGIVPGSGSPMLIQGVRRD